MASKKSGYYDDDNDDDDDDDEGDFVPYADDDSDLDDDSDDQNLDDEEEEEDDDDDEDSPILNGDLVLSGDLFMGVGNSIVYEDAMRPKTFRLASEGPLPAAWSLQKPVLEKPVLFVGWMEDSAHSLKFEIGISKLDTSVALDPFENDFVEAVEQDQLDIPEMSDLKPPARAKCGESEDEEDVKQASLKSPASFDRKKAALQAIIYVFEGSELTKDIGVTARKIRGLFRVPAGDISSIFLMSRIRTFQEAGLTSSPVAKAASASTARKRGRGDDDDDDDDDGDDGVGYHELIALHDDAGLSTDELRRRYYGGAAKGDESKPKKKEPKASDDDDYDDDAYGF